MRLTTTLSCIAAFVVAFTRLGYAEDDWYMKILNEHKKEIFRIEVRWTAEDGLQCDVPGSGTGFLLSNHGRIAYLQSNRRPELQSYRTQQLKSTKLIAHHSIAQSIITLVA